MLAVQYPDKVNRVLQVFLSTPTGWRIYYLAAASTLPLFLSSFHIFSSPTFFLQFIMVCKNLGEKLYSKIIFGNSHYEAGKKYCRRCEVYLFHDGMFCPLYYISVYVSSNNFSQFLFSRNILTLMKLGLVFVTQCDITGIPIAAFTVVVLT